MSMSSSPSPPFLPSILPPPTLPLVLDLRALGYYCQVTPAALGAWAALPPAPCSLPTSAALTNKT